MVLLVNRIEREAVTVLFSIKIMISTTLFFNVVQLLLQFLFSILCTSSLYFQKQFSKCLFFHLIQFFEGSFY